MFKYVPIFVNFDKLVHFLLTPFKSLTVMSHVSLNVFFFKCPRVNPIVCHVSKLMFYIQFDPIFVIFV